MRRAARDEDDDGNGDGDQDRVDASLHRRSVGVGFRIHGIEFTRLGVEGSAPRINWARTNVKRGLKGRGGDFQNSVKIGRESHQIGGLMST